MQNNQKFSSINQAQKEAVGLLSIGTFLEFFDLMLYVHISLILNELFFPETDPHTAKLLAALSFCMIFLLRPFGALLFGYLGDKIGRKATVVITTAMMSLSCLTMFLLPTYAQIGIAAAWIMLICRAVQGVSSLGEVIGSEIYLTESIRRPAVFPMGGLMIIAVNLGGVAALGTASLVTNYGFNWRYAFLVGASIAFVGAIAKMRLSEPPEFEKAKQAAKKAYQRQTSKLLSLGFFFLGCGRPVCFYLAYVYCAFVLKDLLNFSVAQIVYQNLGVALVELAAMVVLTVLSYKVYPLKILKAQLAIFSSFILVFPYLLLHASTSLEIFLVQAFIVVFGVNTFPASPIFYSHFPILKRFTSVGLVFSFSQSAVYAITSFGFIYLTQYFGYYGPLLVVVPILVGYAFGLYYFEKLEIDKGNIAGNKPSHSLNPSSVIALSLKYRKLSP